MAECDAFCRLHNPYHWLHDPKRVWPRREAHLQPFVVRSKAEWDAHPEWLVKPPPAGQQGAGND